MAVYCAIAHNGRFSKARARNSIAHGDRTPMTIRFKPNTRKALEVILWFAQKRSKIDFHSVLKLLFFAEKRHLNKWGRPIVGDCYYAAPYGPVAQTTYDIMRQEPLAIEMLQIDDGLPFKVIDRYYIQSEREPDRNWLSRSDIECLEDVWGEYGHLGFNQLTMLSHYDPAYRRAEEAGHQRMDYADFLEGDQASDELIAELEETAPRLRL